MRKKKVPTKSRTKKDVAIMTVAFNKKAVLAKCLSALKKSNSISDFDIFVIDNNSSDDIRSVADRYSSSYLRLKKNFFASRAINMGFNHFNIAEKYKYIIIMGSDVLVDPNMISELKKTMQADATIGISGPSHYDISTNTLMTYGLNIHKITSLLVNTLDPKSRNKMNHFHSLYMVRTDAFNQIGGLNHVLYPMIYEEPDLGERMKKKNYIIYSSPRAKIWHSLDYLFEGKKDSLVVHKERLYNSVPKAYLFIRNRLIYMSQYSSFFQFLLFYFFVNPAIMLYYMSKMDFKYMTYAVKGYIDGTWFAITKNQSFIKKRNQRVLDI